MKFRFSGYWSVMSSVVNLRESASGRRARDPGSSPGPGEN